MPQDLLIFQSVLSFEFGALLALYNDGLFVTLKNKAIEKESKQEKKKPAQTEPAEKDKEVSVSLLNIQVGLIRKAWKHPSADR